MKSRPELHGQTALRGIAALVVFLEHAEFFTLFPAYPVVERLHQAFAWHNIAVDLFFELSGFILGYVYLDRAFLWREYAVARFSRLYPLYLTATLFYLAMNLLAFAKRGILDAHVSVSSVISNLLLVQNWPFAPYFPSIDPPGWSISVEIFLYIFLFPLLFYGRKYLSTALKVFMAVIPVALLAVCYSTPSIARFPGDPDIGLLRGFLCFTSGFCVCLLGLDTGFKEGTSRKMEFFILLLTASCLLFEFPFGRNIAVIGFPFLVYFSAQPSSLLTRLIATPTLCWLGDLSYSVYLWHWPILKFLGVMLGMRKMGSGSGPAPDSPYIALGVVLVCIITVLAVSHVSHFYFERPVSKWMRSFLKTRKNKKVSVN